MNCFGLHTEDGILCLVMDFCDGGELAKQIRRTRRKHQKIPEELVLRWFTQAMLALKHVHDKHIVHRDLKPGGSLNFGGHKKWSIFRSGVAPCCTSFPEVISSWPRQEAWNWETLGSPPPFPPSQLSRVVLRTTSAQRYGKANPSLRHQMCGLWDAFSTRFALCKSLLPGIAFQKLRKRCLNCLRLFFLALMLALSSWEYAEHAGLDLPG